VNRAREWDVMAFFWKGERDIKSHRASSTNTKKTKPPTKGGGNDEKEGGREFGLTKAHFFLDYGVQGSGIYSSEMEKTGSL